MNLGNNIRKFRQEKKLKQEELANALSKSTSVISNWEKGINKPDADTIGSICKIFSITPNELFDWDKNSQINDISTKYNQLDEYGKELVNTIIGLELKRIGKNPKVSKCKPSPTIIKENNVKTFSKQEPPQEMVKIVARGKGVTYLSKEEMDEIEKNSRELTMDEINDLF